MCVCMSTSMVKGFENDTIFSSQTSLAWCFPIFFVVSSDGTFWRKIAGILSVKGFVGADTESILS